MYEWQSGAHQPGGAAGVVGGALDAVELEDESWSRRMAAAVWPPRHRAAGTQAVSAQRVPLAAGGGRGGGGGGRDADGALKTGNCCCSMCLLVVFNNFTCCLCLCLVRAFQTPSDLFRPSLRSYVREDRASCVPISWPVRVSGRGRRRQPRRPGPTPAFRAQMLASTRPRTSPEQRQRHRRQRYTPHDREHHGGP